MKTKIHKDKLVSMIQETARKVISESLNNGEQDLNSVLYDFDYTAEKLQRFGNWLLKLKGTLARVIPGFVEYLAEGGLTLDGMSYSFTDDGIVLSYKNYRLDRNRIDRDILDDYGNDEELIVDCLIDEVASYYRHEINNVTINSIRQSLWNKEILFELSNEFNPEVIKKTIPDV